MNRAPINYRIHIPAILLATFFAPAMCPDVCQAQNPFRPSFNQTVQLPVVRFFNVQTAVKVPDGGTMSLGGVTRHSEGSRSSGIPGLPFRPFRNRGIGYDSGASQVLIKPRLIISSELEADVLAEADRREAVRAKSDPNGSKEVQRKADFISRNIGRRK